jgi:hypothetical protein
VGIVHTQDSAHARELAKWESQPTAQCPSPLRPYVYQEVPTMCYYAERPVGGGEVAWRKERGRGRKRWSLICGVAAGASAKPKR